MQAGQICKWNQTSCSGTKVTVGGRSVGGGSVGDIGVEGVGGFGVRGGGVSFLGCLKLHLKGQLPTLSHHSPVCYKDSSICCSGMEHQRRSEMRVPASHTSSLHRRQRREDPRQNTYCKED